MAIFNYANTLEEVKGYLETSSDSYDYLKLIFTGDGHIITHGNDFTADFAPGQRGLVSGSTGNPIDILRANNTWASISVNDLPISESLAITSDDLHIPTSKAVTDYIGNFIRVSETLRFKGVIDYARGKYYVNNSTTSGFPDICEIGDSYRVGSVEGGTAEFAGMLCEPGDILICIKSNTDSNNSSNSSEYWTVIQTNINGTKKTTINGVEQYFYATSSDPLDIFAPNTVGDSGDILISVGKGAPKWGKLSFIEGNLAVSDELVIPVEASKLFNPLNAGVGLIFDDANTSYNGSFSSTLNLQNATTSTIGGIKIDSDHGENGGATISIDNDGTLYLSSDNIKNALGYDIMGAYQLADFSNKGLVPSLNTTNGMVTSEYYILAFKDEDSLDWYQLPNSVFQDTWRDIQVDDESIGTKTLNIRTSEDIHAMSEDVGDERYLSFAINWYNISTNQLES